LCSGFNTINVSTWTTVPTIGAMSFSGFQTDGTVIVPANYTIIGISLDTFAGLPDTWQLQVV
jgi:hypothetical protein